MNKLDVPVLKDLTVRTEYVDDGTKAGGLALGFTGSHGPLSHEFVTTVGNRVSKFEKFVTYKHNDNVTFAVASQGTLMNIM